MSWNRIRLGDIAIFRNGINFGKESYGKGVSLIGVSDFKNRFYPDYETLDEVKESVVGVNDYLDYGDIVFVRSNGNKELVGRCMVIKPTKSKITYSGFCIRTRIKNKTEHDPIFWTYHFKNISFRKSMSGNAVGTNIQNLSQGMLSDYEAEVPDYNTQLRIASILVDYDNLIENNQKQIKLLEEAAQRLYKEWFVDLRFPGHENVEVVDGVPEGWKIRKLGDLNHRLESGSRPKGGIDSNLKDGIPSIGAENVIGLGKYNFSSEKLISKEFYESMNKGKLKDRDILIYKDGAYIGRTSLFQDDFPHREASVNEHVFLLHMDDESLQYYVFLTLYRPEYYLKMQNLNKNAAQPGINMKAFKTLDILVPDEAIVVEFNDLVRPMIKSIFSKSKQIKILTEARDRLLPKLMSGEIEV